ncbi:MAG: DUF2267 domain-containing protein [Polyangiaceae bacterium]
MFANVPSRDLMEWVAILRARTGLDSEEVAEHVLEAVIDSLGERLTPDEARLVAGYLPERLSDLLLRGSNRHESVPPAGPDEVGVLVGAVAWRENVSRSDALEHALSVCEIVEAALPAEVLTKLRADLPSDLASLLRQEPRVGLVGRVRSPSSYRPPEPRPHLSTASPPHLASAAPSHHTLSEAKGERSVSVDKPLRH